MLLALGACLTLAAQPDLPPRYLPGEHFTLAWTHSIEKQRWEEDYRIERNPHGQIMLIPGQARIRGSGAGMEPPADAQLLANGWYAYQPHTAPLQALRLTRSHFVPDYDWCVHGQCRPLRALMPSDGGVTVLRPCEAPR
ncbi:DUF1850 domain-containing protein [Castellaniella sp.]|uniref:DUF1850 domain-containing protein n=1 Tax=Castellaniella sp. TaxID=1955812 RepID=UPI00355D47C3